MLRILVRFLLAAPLCLVALSTGSAPAEGAPTLCPSVPIDIVNGGFEEPAINEGFPTTLDAGSVPGWSTTASDNMIELWHAGYLGVPAAEGTQFAELNAHFASELYQTISTTPGTEMTYVVRHRGRTGVDVANIQFGPEGGPPNYTVEMSDDDTAWGTYVGSYTIPPGQTSTTFGFVAVSTSSGGPADGNFLDGIRFGTAGCLTVSKTVADLSGRAADGVQVDDVVRYTVEVANPGGAAVAAPRVVDVVPAGLQYVADSVTVLGGSQPGPRTDADDGDGVTVSGGQILVDLSTGGPVVIRAGTSARFTFDARVDGSSAGDQVTNVVTADYVEPRLGTTRRAVSDDATITVLALPPSPGPPSTATASPSPSPGGALPATGAGVMIPFALATALVVCGASAVRWARVHR